MACSVSGSNSDSGVFQAHDGEPLVYQSESSSGDGKEYGRTIGGSASSAYDPEFFLKLAAESEAGPATRPPLSEAGPATRPPLSEAGPATRPPLSEAGPATRPTLSEAGPATPSTLSEESPEGSSLKMLQKPSFTIRARVEGKVVFVGELKKFQLLSCEIGAAHWGYFDTGLTRTTEDTKCYFPGYAGVVFTVPSNELVCNYLSEFATDFFGLDLLKSFLAKEGNLNCDLWKMFVGMVKHARADVKYLHNMRHFFRGINNSILRHWVRPINKGLKRPSEEEENNMNRFIRELVDISGGAFSKSDHYKSKVIYPNYLEDLDPWRYLPNPFE